MDDNEHVARRYMESVMSGDPHRMAEDLHPDVVVRYPQSGEVITGRDTYVAMLDAFPGGLAHAEGMEVSGGSQEVSVVRPAPFTMPQITVSGSGNLFVAEGVATYANGDVYHIALIMEFAGGAVRKETWYFGAPFEAPSWRGPYTERQSDGD